MRVYSPRCCPDNLWDSALPGLRRRIFQRKNKVDLSLRYILHSKGTIFRDLSVPCCPRPDCGEKFATEQLDVSLKCILNCQLPALIVLSR